MIDNLVKTLPESRRPALLEERDLLDRAIEKLYGRESQESFSYLR